MSLMMHHLVLSLGIQRLAYIVRLLLAAELQVSICNTCAT